MTRAAILGLERDFSVARTLNCLRDELLQRNEEGILASPSYISLLYNFLESRCVRLAGYRRSAYARLISKTMESRRGERDMNVI